MLGLLGKKKGMTQIFGDNGEVIPVTVVEVGPCVVVQKKTKERDGYDALQLGFDDQKERRLTKARLKHFDKSGSPYKKHLKEFRGENLEAIAEGQEIKADAFQVGDVVHVRGTTKGRGFQGVMKRHGKGGGPASHGSGFHRAPGSIGMCSTPSRVFKGMKLPGHMGVDQVMVRNLKVVAVRPEQNLVLIRGAVPGSREGLIEVFTTDGGFIERDAFKKDDQGDGEQSSDQEQNAQTEDGAEQEAAPAENAEAATEA